MHSSTDKTFADQQLENELGQIAKLKRQTGRQLLLLAHHYQRREIVEIADFVGDSYALAAQAAKQ